MIPVAVIYYPLDTGIDVPIIYFDEEPGGLDSFQVRLPPELPHIHPHIDLLEEPLPSVPWPLEPLPMSWLSPPSPLIFSVIVTNNSQAKLAADIILALGQTEVAVIHNDGAVKTLKDEFEARLQKAGGMIVDVQRAPRRQDFKQALKIIADHREQEMETGNVAISHIFNDGIVKRIESDEYAQITNKGSVPVNLKGWYLKARDSGQEFWFPDFVIRPGQSCRVHTNEYHPESCGFSFRSGRALWNNKEDCGYLYDATGAMVADYCYPLQQK